jgi:hypothetical protein
MRTMRLRSCGGTACAPLPISKSGYAEAVERGKGNDFLALLGSDPGGPPRLCAMLDAIRDEEWMDAIRYWHDDVHTREHSIRFPEPA